MIDTYTLTKASEVKLPSVFLNFALQNTHSVGEFLKLIIDMKNWDTKQVNEFFCKYPGLLEEHRKQQSKES